MAISREEGRATSDDGGKTWSRPTAIHGVDGQVINGRASYHTILRLKSGALGGFSSGNAPTSGPYSLNEYFSRSEDEGKTWSRPVRVGRVNQNANMRPGGATVTSSGRVVGTVMDLLGFAATQAGKTRARFQDRYALIGHHGYSAHFCYCWSESSDDEGKTWEANAGRGVWAAGGELFVTLDETLGGHHGCEEPTIAEVSPGKLLMLQRTNLGRLFQSWSTDNGTHWTRPEPTNLAASQAPATLIKLPRTGDLLVIWNQSSPEEIERGLQRHRLSSAISKDGGETWIHGRNIYSTLAHGDDTTRVEVPPIRPYRAMKDAPTLPAHDVEATYSEAALWKDTVIVRFFCTERTALIYDSEGKYDSEGTLGFQHREMSEEEWARHLGLNRPPVRLTTVCLGLPISWFYKS